MDITRKYLCNCKSAKYLNYLLSCNITNKMHIILVDPVAVVSIPCDFYHPRDLSKARRCLQYNQMAKVLFKKFLHYSGIAQKHLPDTLECIS